jgi:hypothetical protein
VHTRSVLLRQLHGGQMARQPKQSSFDKRRWFIQLTAVVGLIAAVTGIITGIVPLFDRSLKKVSQNTEIVFDRSKLMDGSLQGQPKLKVAQDAVDLILRKETVGDNLALRVFGGKCTDDATPPLVSFGQDNAARVSKELSTLKAEGDATLIAALHAAIADFNDEARFGGVSKRLIVITGSKDQCSGKILEIVQQLNRNNQAGAKGAIQLDLNFIGIGLDTAAKQELDQMAEHTGGAAHFVDEPGQLQHVIEVMEVRRVTRSATLVNELLNASTDGVNVVIANFNKQDYSAAESAFKQAREQFDRSELPFHDLEKRQSSEQFSAELTALYRLIFEAANKSRDLQNKVLALAEDLLSKRNDQAALKESIDKFNGAKDAYNQSQGDLLKRVNDLYLKAQSM